MDWPFIMKYLITFQYHFFYYISKIFLITFQLFDVYDDILNFFNFNYDIINYFYLITF